MKSLKRLLFVTVVFSIAATFLYGCKDGGTLQSITVTSASPAIARGTQQQFIATAIFSDGTTVTWNSAAIWKSTDINIASVSNTPGSIGLVSTLNGKGTVTITATDSANPSISGTAELHVLDPIAIVVTPSSPFMVKDSKHQFKAEALLEILSDSTTTISQDLTSSPTISWFSEAPLIATVSGSGYVTTGGGAGQTKIQAYSLISSATPTGISTLTVTDTAVTAITITPQVGHSLPGETVQFEATGIYTSATDTRPFTESVIWSSAEPSKVTISNETGSKGLATSSAQDSVMTTIITATDPITGITGTASFQIP